VKKIVKTTASLLAMVVMILIMVIACKKENDPFTVTDIDGNVYKTVVIGIQTWMAENLRTTKFNDGSPIPLFPDYPQWFSLSTPGYCWYDNNEAAYKEDYGAIYNWYSVSTGKLCPKGWHVPSDGDWQKLALFIDPNATNEYFMSSDGGGKLKETGTEHWSIPNDGATDEYGFSALPGGCRLTYESPDYYGIKEFGFWWSTTEYNNSRVWIIDMGYNYSLLVHYYVPKNNGHSVRCIKD